MGTLDINLDNWAPISWGDGILYRGPFILADCIFSIRGRYFPQEGGQGGRDTCYSPPQMETLGMQSEISSGPRIVCSYDPSPEPGLQNISYPDE